MNDPYGIKTNDPYGYGGQTTTPTVNAATPSTPFDATKLGILKNTITGLPKAALGVGKDILQSISRSGGSLGLTLSGNKELPVPPGGVEKKVYNTVFGDQPLKSIQKRITDNSQTIEQSPFAKKFGLDKISKPLAFAGVVGGDALNFIPGGGEENLVKTLAKETDTSVISSLLKKIGTEEKLIPKFTEIFSKTTNPEEIKQGLDALHNAQKVGMAAGEIKQPVIPKETPPPVTENKYVKLDDLNFTKGKNDKATSNAIRSEFTGVRNAQIVRGTQLSDSIRKAVPDKVAQDALSFIVESGGDKSLIEKSLSDPKFAEYKPTLEKALNPTPEMVNALKEGTTYYKEAGQVSKDLGTIHNIRDNYANRIYQPEPSKDFVKTELTSGLKQTTSHGKRRIFDTIFDAIQNDKKPATVNFPDLLSIHNEEMARVNTAVKLTDSMKEAGLHQWVNPKDIPEGWTKTGLNDRFIPLKDKTGAPLIGDSGNQAVNHLVSVAPEGIAKGIRAIAEPNFAKKIDLLRGIDKYQAVVKTYDLALSFFHHFTFAMQTLYQGGANTLLKAPLMNKIVESPEFANIEQDFMRHEGITTKVADNQDILRNIAGKDSKLGNLPVIKQFNKLTQSSGEFLFGKVQRFLKVSDYGNKISSWLASHPNATNEEVVAAKKGFSQEINAAYGGLNWEAMGFTKSEITNLRRVLLAPDWTISNLKLGQYAFKGGTVGSAARANIAKSLIEGIALTEGVNKIMTGHFTDQNPKGHGLEVEVSPGVYVSFLRGGIGDIIKLGSKIETGGVVGGTSSYLQGKLAPIPRTAVGLLSGVDYTQRPITQSKSGFLGKTAQSLGYVAANATPLPFGVSNTTNYLGDKKKTLLGGATIASGIGNYRPTPKKKSRASTY